GRPCRCLRSRPLAWASARLQRLRQPHLEAQRDELPPDPPPAGRRLDHHRHHPATPGLSPAGQALPISREPLLDNVTTVGIDHSRLERQLMDIDRRVHQHEPPLIETEARSSSSTVRTEPYDIQKATRLAS